MSFRPPSQEQKTSSRHQVLEHLSNREYCFSCRPYHDAERKLRVEKISGHCQRTKELDEYVSDTYNYHSNNSKDICKYLKHEEELKQSR